MLILPKSALSDVIGSLVSATHQMHNADGSELALRTYDDKTMRTAALTALFVLTGETVETKN